MESDKRIFAGCFPTGIVYADTKHETNGDYTRLAYLNYRTLELEIEKNCPRALAEEIRADAATIQAKRGERFAIAGNMSITLGE